jgi:hypothetical protein
MCMYQHQIIVEFRSNFFVFLLHLSNSMSERSGIISKLFFYLALVFKDLLVDCKQHQCMIVSLKLINKKLVSDAGSGCVSSAFD